MAIQVLKQKEINEVSGGLVIGVGANAATPILSLDLNLGNLLGTVNAVAGLLLGSVTSLLGGVLGTLGSLGLGRRC